MVNPKTTIAGYAILAIALGYLAWKAAFGGGLVLDDLKAVIGIITGAGLIASEDGGH